MTRDAKVGLLLGLVFIFIIAFIINGLPGLRGSDGNELTRNMARPVSSNHGIGTAAKKVTRDTITPIRPVRDPVLSPSQDATTTQMLPVKQEDRFTAKLPNPKTTLSPTIEPGSLITAFKQPVSPIQQVLSADKPKATKVQRINRPRIYTVRQDDSLASIAKRFYGDELGNKKINVDRVYKANRKILSSPDSIYIGQKLIIPVLADVRVNTSQPEKVLSGEQFQPVESIGARHDINVQKQTSKSRYYIVKEGDSLWKIAAAQLGNGNRYTEIIDLNKNALKDEDYLAVGMRLKLPQK